MEITDISEGDLSIVLSEGNYRLITNTNGLGRTTSLYKQYYLTVLSEPENIHFNPIFDHIYKIGSFSEVKKGSMIPLDVKFIKSSVQFLGSVSFEKFTPYRNKTPIICEDSGDSDVYEYQFQLIIGVGCIRSPYTNNGWYEEGDFEILERDFVNYEDGSTNYIRYVIGRVNEDLSVTEIDTTTIYGSDFDELNGGYEYSYIQTESRLKDTNPTVAPVTCGTSGEQFVVLEEYFNIKEPNDIFIRVNKGHLVRLSYEVLSV
jgi:hypothetical protein